MVSSYTPDRCYASPSVLNSKTLMKHADTILSQDKFVVSSHCEINILQLTTSKTNTLATTTKATSKITYNIDRYTAHSI